MPILNSKTGEIRKDYTIKQLKEAANLMRGYNLVALNCASSGHSGGTLSIMDIAAALYLKVAKHDPENPNWDDRDRIIWSAGHKAPALYVSLGMSGYFPVEEVVKLRKYNSPFQGHPNWLVLPGVEISAGSLGQGFSVAVGMALNAKLDKKEHKIFVITGDGEWDEGSMWEAAMAAANYKLDNLIVVCDRNYMQSEGTTEEIMKLSPLDKKLDSFGFEVINIDGNDMDQILNAFEKAQNLEGKPVAIIAKTIKGKGVSFMEGVAGWHARAPNDEELEQALGELGILDKLDVGGLKKIAQDYQKKVDDEIEGLMPKFKTDYFWNHQDNMKVQMTPTRDGFGQALAEAGSDERIVCLGMDLSDSVRISEFYKVHPERRDRFFTFGIQEQNATTAAAGFAREGKLPVISTYSVFCSLRNADQIRNTICFGNLNVLLAGTHAGVSVGPDGPTHQALEDISVINSFPNMNLVVPCDSIEASKATKHLLFNVKGPKYVRLAREGTAVITDENTPFVFGKANVIRFRKEATNFKDAYETTLASKYNGEGEAVAIFACGQEVPEAMRAAWILKNEFGVETRVVNIHTIKPLDKEVIVRTAREVGIIVTVEDHQKGGFGNLITAVIMEANLNKTLKFAMVGVNDCFGPSGAPWELVKAFGLTAEHIAKQAMELKGATVIHSA